MLAIAAPWHVLAYAAKSALLRLDDALEPGGVSRLLLVLLPERAPVPVFEYALSARLQHGAPGVVLAASLCVAVPVFADATDGSQARLCKAR